MHYLMEDNTASLMGLFKLQILQFYLSIDNVSVLKIIFPSSFSDE